MIPKIIHYCWFGRNPLPESAQKCIASWRKFFPDYEIWQWSEEPLNENENQSEKNLYDKILGFDVNSIPYTREAYEAKKYAFVSDYARFWILYNYGGLYFDTDVEVIKTMDDIIERGPFMGIELIEADGMPQVNPGLGLGTESEKKIYCKVLDYYKDQHFLNEDGSLNQTTVVTRVTGVLAGEGLQVSDGEQQVGDIWIYPKDFFNPLDDLTGRILLTDHTRSIHWYRNSWSDNSPIRRWFSRLSHRVFGMRIHQLRESVHKIINNC